MIRLRKSLERARKHPVLGPVVLILLLIVLAMVVLHTAMDSHDGATEVGVLCMAVLVLLGSLLFDRVRLARLIVVVAERISRGPPLPHVATRDIGASSSGITIPLRR